MAFPWENELACVKYCLGVYEQNKIRVHVDDWTAEKTIIASNESERVYSRQTKMKQSNNFRLRFRSVYANLYGMRKIKLLAVRYHRNDNFFKKQANILIHTLTKS